MKIRRAKITELSCLAELEAACFPAAEAATYESLEARMEAFLDYFLVAELDSKVVGFIDGAVINESVIADVCYENPYLHDKNGKYQAVYGISCLPEYRKMGIGGKLLDTFCENAKNEGRLGCVLTCKEHLLHFYESHGFENLGISKSSHGGAVWNDMIREF